MKRIAVILSSARFFSTQKKGSYPRIFPIGKQVLEITWIAFKEL